MRRVLLSAMLLSLAIGVDAATREVQLGCGAPVVNEFDLLVNLARATHTNRAHRLRLTWFDNGMDMEDSGTLLYDRDAHTLAYFVDFENFGTLYRKSYLFSGVSDAMLHRAALYVGTLSRAGSSYPDGFLDVLLRYGARKKKRFDITTKPRL